MSDIQALWEKSLNDKTFSTPEEERDFELNRLFQLSQAAVLQTIWRVEARRFLFYLFGSIIIPPLVFKGSTYNMEPGTVIMGSVGLGAYVLSVWLIFFLGKRIPLEDIDEELDKAMETLRTTDALYRKRWKESDLTAPPEQPTATTED